MTDSQKPEQDSPPPQPEAPREKSPQEAAQAYQAQADARSRSEVVREIARELERKRLTGIGGWLILYIVLQSLNLLYSVVTSFSSDEELCELAREFPRMNERIAAWPDLALPLNLLIGAMLIYSFYLMAKARKRFVNVTIWTLVLQCVASLIGCMLLFNLLGDMQADFMGSLSGQAYSYADSGDGLYGGGYYEVQQAIDMLEVVLYITIALTITYTAAWIAYFKKSKRVRYTFVD